eukprot:Polyplicarium_translucidae@DN2678_c0_g1_i4.p1
MGTSFGLTLPLHRFWSRLGFETVYLRQSPNEITGEHSSIVIRRVSEDARASKTDEWIQSFSADFRSRLLYLLGGPFAGTVSCTLGLSLVNPGKGALDVQSKDHILPPLTADTVFNFFTAHDLHRIRRYAEQQVDQTVIRDLVTPMATLFFNRRIPGLELSSIQSGTLLALGLQRKSVDEIAAEFNVPANQIMAMFNKAVHRIDRTLSKIVEKRSEEELEREGAKGSVSVPTDAEMPETTFEAELEGGAKEVRQRAREEKQKLLANLNLQDFSRYSLENLDVANLTQQPSGRVSVKRNRDAENEAKVMKKNRKAK